jgi:hypothetical protein
VDTVTPLEAGKPGVLPTLEATEVGLLRLVQPRQHLVQDRTVESRIVGERRPYRRAVGVLINP